MGYTNEFIQIKSSMINKKDLSDTFDAAKQAKEALEKEPEPEPFVSRFDADKSLRSGRSKLDQIEHIVPGFNERVSSRSEIPVERPKEPEPFVSRFDEDKKLRSGRSKLDQIEHITPDFNSNVNNHNVSNDNKDQGRGSEMVENEKPEPELKPAPEDRKASDRKAHLEGMAKDDEAAKLAQLIKMADEISKEEKAHKERDHEMGMER